MLATLFVVGFVSVLLIWYLVDEEQDWLDTKMSGSTAMTFTLSRHEGRT